MRTVKVFGIFLLFIISCTHKKTVNDVRCYTVQKSDFLNKLTIPGSLESGRMINYSCPIRGYDLQINYMILEGTIVRKGDTICYLSNTEIENQYRQAVESLDLFKSELEKTKAQQLMEIKLLESQIKTTEASVSISMLDSSRLEFYTPARKRLSELNLEKANITIAKLKRKLEYKKRIDAATLNKIEIQIKQTESRIKQNFDRLNQLKIVADTTGILVYDRIWGTGQKAKIGDLVWGRSPIMNVVDVSSLQVKLETNEINYKLIQKDYPLDIRIDAGEDTSIYKGKIITKIPEGKLFSRESNVKYFEMISSIEPKPRKIQPGVSVTCTVYLNDIKNAITVPIMTVFDYDSTKIVYKLKKNKFHRQVVKTGPSSEKEIVITSGLKPNDKISLSEPPESLLE